MGELQVAANHWSKPAFATNSDATQRIARLGLFQPLQPSQAPARCGWLPEANLPVVVHRDMDSLMTRPKCRCLYGQCVTQCADQMIPSKML
jgi:hypothetical protein